MDSAQVWMLGVMAMMLVCGIIAIVGYIKNPPTNHQKMR